MQEYTVKIEGFILGLYRQKREKIALAPQQAVLFLREGRIEAAGAKRAPKETAKADIKAKAD